MKGMYRTVFTLIAFNSIKVLTYLVSNNNLSYLYTLAIITNVQKVDLHTSRQIDPNITYATKDSLSRIYSIPDLFSIPIDCARPKSI